MSVPHTLTTSTAHTRGAVTTARPTAIEMIAGDVHWTAFYDRVTVATAIALVITDIVVQLIDTGPKAESAKCKGQQAV